MQQPNPQPTDPREEIAKDMILAFADTKRDETRLAEALDTYAAAKVREAEHKLILQLKKKVGKSRRKEHNRRLKLDGGNGECNTECGGCMYIGGYDEIERVIKILDHALTALPKEKP